MGIPVPSHSSTSRTASSSSCPQDMLSSLPISPCHHAWLSPALLHVIVSLPVTTIAWSASVEATLPASRCIIAFRKPSTACSTASWAGE
eukprot:CAMPEP_0182877902 /NCGR_PEP_ID=MMETSP0034_2-20130328/15038_1 /TAXON_ID=156128 /ORGANISM="Nephroselmis pyriformis, Strain CCMP717" /LENGTH=88 /DNA_ID=CAMNT_0025010769 /DNA_START=188 /DNA_END=454 /DNA_ORIENTATION=-